MQKNQQYQALEFTKRNKTKGYYQKKLSDQSGSLILREQRIKGIQKPMKIVAKQARNRKKIYYEMLEQQCSQLKLKVKELQKENQILKQKTIPLEAQQNNQKDQQKSFNELLEEMKRMHQNLATNSVNEVDRSLSILRDKYGISGRLRVKQIESLFDRLIELLMPMHFRVLMENSEDNRKFYSLISKSNRYHSQKFNQIQKNALLQMRPLFCSHKKEYSKIIQNLNTIQQTIKYQNWICQGIIDNIQEKMDAIFVGKLLISLDQQREQEIYPCNQWHQIKAKQKYKPFLDQNHQTMDPIFREGIDNINNNQSFAFQCDNQIFDELFL